MAAPTIINKPNIVNYSLDPMYFVFQSSKFSGDDPPFTADYPNLSLYVEIWTHDLDTETDTFIVSCQIPYDPYNKQAVIDVSSVIDVKPQLPDLEQTSGQAENVHKKIFIKYADQFGTPVVPETLTEFRNSSNVYWSVIYGHSRSTIGAFDVIGGFPLHSYKSSRTNSFIAKEVTKDQPDWLFFFLSGNGDKDVNVYSVVYFDDNTNENTDQQTITLKGNTVNWISSSYKDRILPSEFEKTVIAYRVVVTTPVGLGIAVVIKQSYIIDQVSERDIFIATFNGIGGFESVRMRGMTSYDVEKTGSIIELTQWGAINDAIGTVDMINVSGHDVIRMNTGYYDEDYINHIKNMIFAPCFLIENDKFVKIIPTTASLKDVKNNDEDLFDLSVTFRDSRNEAFKNTQHINVV